MPEAVEVTTLRGVPRNHGLVPKPTPSPGDVVVDEDAITVIVLEDGITAIELDG